jgi:hypothetical protein
MLRTVNRIQEQITSSENVFCFPGFQSAHYFAMCSLVREGNSPPPVFDPLLKNPPFQGTEGSHEIQIKQLDVVEKPSEEEMSFITWEGRMKPKSIRQ